LIPSVTTTPINKFHGKRRDVEELRIRCESTRMNVIEAVDGELITRKRIEEPRVENGQAVADPSRDILKIAVLNRYEDAPPALAFVRGFGMKHGAIASSVAHDSHNVIAIGASDEDLAAAINAVVDEGGGLALACGDERRILPLPVAGLMSTDTCAEVASSYSLLDRRAKELGTTLRAPFMTLSFLALLVIPEIKLSDKGLFDAERFEFLPLFV
jgi:adenine deaminase